MIFLLNQYGSSISPILIRAARLLHKTRPDLLLRANERQLTFLAPELFLILSHPVYKI